jgi:uroporphyrinogen-III synthase
VHLAGEAVAFDLAESLETQGFSLRRTVLYRAVPAPDFPPGVLAMLQAGGLEGVILMSPRTARIFADLLARHGAVTQAKGLICYCLSHAVAEPVARLGYETRVAASPREEDVLALLGAEAASL